MNTRSITTLVIALILCANNLFGFSFDGNKALVARIAPWLSKHVTFKAIKSDKDIFRIKSVNGTVVIEASSPSAASTAIHYYLKNYCQQSDALMGSNLHPLSAIPAVPVPVEKSSSVKYRHGMYHCTYNYSASFWEWEQYEKLIDWLALEGVNQIFAFLGTEIVEQEVLRKMGFPEKEILTYLNGPAYTNWRILGSIEGWGGPNQQGIINRQCALQQRILQRLKELGIEPILQGFSGLVPNYFTTLYPNANTINQGTYVGLIKRPILLDSGDPLYKKYSTLFYNALHKYYGKQKFYSYDLFHEGGVVCNTDMPRTVNDGLNAMQKNNPNSIWVTQAWEGQGKFPEGTPPDIFLNNVPKKSVLVVDIFNDGDNAWERRNGFNQTPWSWGVLSNMGNKTGMYGKLDRFANEFHRALNTTPGNTLIGMGINPEGIENNPVLFDFIYDLAWQGKQKVDVTEWLQHYVVYRYGKNSPSLQKAWELLHQTVYNSHTEVHQGPSESIFLARPSDSVRSVSTWGTIKIFYNPALLEKAAEALLQAAPDYQNNKAYQYDLIDVVRQVNANRGRTVYDSMMLAYKQRNVSLFDQYATHFTTLLLRQDKMLNAQADFRLGKWLLRARQFGKTEEEKKLAEKNARMLITYWGDDNPKTPVYDYSNREWAGLLKDYYLPRWQWFIKDHHNRLLNQPADSLDLFQFAVNWSEKRGGYSDPPKGNIIELATEVLKSK